LTGKKKEGKEKNEKEKKKDKKILKRFNQKGNSML